MKASEAVERAAQASGRYSDEEWAALVGSDDPLDKCTVTNARAVATNILVATTPTGDYAELVEALRYGKDVESWWELGAQAADAITTLQQRLAAARELLVIESKRRYRGLARVNDLRTLLRLAKAATEPKA